MNVNSIFPQKFVEGRNPLLELCPFCGEAAEIFKDETGFGVNCSNGDCPFKPVSRKHFETEELAIKAWNTRKGGN